MTKESRPAGNRTAHDQRGTRSTQILPQTHRYPRKIQLSDTAETYIAALAVDLLLDELQLGQVPWSLRQLWEFGYQTGRESRQPEIDQANADADRLRWERNSWYFIAPNKGKRPADYHTHVTDMLWAEASR